MNNNELYEQDFNLWVNCQINLLKAGKINEIDIDHLVAELADMGKSQLRELNSHFKILIAHLLKWEFQLTTLKVQLKEFEGRSWQRTIIEQRSQLFDLLEDVPSLKRELFSAIKKAYPKAVILAAKETGLPFSTFPIDCPYTIEQLLDDDFYPKNGECLADY